MTGHLLALAVPIATLTSACLLGLGRGWRALRNHLTRSSR